MQWAFKKCAYLCNCIAICFILICIGTRLYHYIGKHSILVQCIQNLKLLNESTAKMQNKKEFQTYLFQSSSKGHPVHCYYSRVGVNNSDTYFEPYQII